MLFMIEEKILSKNRKCEVCGKDDLETNVTSSALGAFSANYCILCSGLCAERKGLEKIVGYNYVTYNSINDSYIGPDGKNMDIKLSDGSTFKTRSEFVKYYNKQ